MSRPEVPTLDPYEPPSSPPSSAGTGVESPKVKIGYLTLKACSEKVIARLSCEPKTMADALHGKGFISTETLREISQVPATTTDNARKLYLSLLECVEHHPHRYSEFISVLSENTRLYDDLLKVLEETYQEKAAEVQAVSPTLDLYDKNSHSTFLSSQPNSPAMSVEWFEERFHGLRKSALAELSVKGVTVQDFRQTLMTLPNAITKEHEQFLLSKYHLFEEAKSIESIFLHLNFYLSFIDFSLLEHIIQHFGSHELKQRMKKYSQDMALFRMETTVADVLPHLSGRPEPPPEYVKLKVKLDFNVQSSTLEDLEQERKRIGSEFSLSKFTLFLVEMREGSLVLVWLIPSELVSVLKEHILQKGCRFFRDCEILELAIPKVEQPSLSTLPKSFQSAVGPHATPLKKSIPTGELKENLLLITPSAMEIADGITSTIESTPNARGLAIIHTFKGLDSLGYNFLRAVRLLYSSTFQDLKFATDSASRVNPRKWNQFSYAASQLARYPKSPDFSIVVVVTGLLGIDINKLGSSPSNEVNISRDIIEPFLPPSAPDLADIPKVFIINAFPIRSSDYLSRLSVPSGGNFIFSYINMARGDLEDSHVLRVLQHELRTSRESVEDVLTNVKGQLLPKYLMTVISHLDKPVYLHPDGPQKTSDKMLRK